MFNFGAENLGGPEQGEKFKNGVEKMKEVIDNFSSGKRDEELKNNQDFSI
jgi:hypothetical protein